MDAQEIKQIAEQMNLGVQQGFVEHPDTGEYIPFDEFIQWYNRQNKKDSNTLKHKDMRQQVEVIVKMTFDVDAGIDQEQAKQEIAYWISETMQTMDDMESKYDFMGSEIVSIKEEAEIYGNE